MMSQAALLDHLKRIDHADEGESWFATLETRKKSESQFHDHMRDEARIEAIGQDTYEQFHSNKRFYRTAQLSRAYFYDWIDTHSRGKIVLDFACGNGDVALHAARAGAKLAIGIDISGISIRNARAHAAERGFADQTYFLRGDCERTGLPDSSVDVVVCAGVLHHLDLSYALPEIRRILAPGGKVGALGEP